jgi:prophage DNA circulation protein
MSWDFDLETAKWRGVSFNVQKIADSFPRRWVEHEYPYVDGSDTEDMGRRARDTQITAVFLGPDYLDGLSDLIKEVGKGKAGTFQHPLLGTYKARLSIERIEHDDTFRDGCMLELQVKEEGTAGDIEELESTYFLEAEATSAIDAAESAMDDVLDALEEIGDAVDTVQDAIDSAREFVEEATAAVTKAVQSLNKTIRKVDKAIKSAKRLTDLDSYNLVKELRQVDRNVQKLGKRVLGDKWPMKTREVAADTSATALVMDWYGDASRADEIAELNNATVRNPFYIPKGTVLQVFGE